MSKDDVIKTLETIPDWLEAKDIKRAVLSKGGSFQSYMLRSLVRDGKLLCEVRFVDYKTCQSRVNVYKFNN